MAVSGYLHDLFRLFIYENPIYWDYEHVCMAEALYCRAMGRDR